VSRCWEPSPQHAVDGKPARWPALPLSLPIWQSTACGLLLQGVHRYTEIGSPKGLPLHTLLAELAPATPVAQAVQTTLGAAPAVAPSATSALSEAAIAPALGKALESNTPDAARRCDPKAPSSQETDVFGRPTDGVEADHTVTTTARKPRARKASRPALAAPCDRGHGAASCLLLPAQVANDKTRHR
jgi:hypothetical protein